MGDFGKSFYDGHSSANVQKNVASLESVRDEINKNKSEILRLLAKESELKVALSCGNESAVYRAEQKAYEKAAEILNF